MWTDNLKVGDKVIIEYETHNDYIADLMNIYEIAKNSKHSGNI